MCGAVFGAVRFLREHPTDQILRSSMFERLETETICWGMFHFPLIGPPQQQFGPYLQNTR